MHVSSLMEVATLIGFIAAGLTTSSFLPQVIKAVKTKQTKDISFLMYIILLFGIGLWFLYGLLIGDLPIIAANGITLILVSFVFTLKIKYK
jgi:MtN3 and saliva related transmembrane protein